MVFKSNSFTIRTEKKSSAEANTRSLQSRHKQAMDKVLADAKDLAEDRRRTLKSITDPKLRGSAER